MVILAFARGSTVQEAYIRNHQVRVSRSRWRGAVSAFDNDGQKNTSSCAGNDLMRHYLAQGQPGFVAFHAGLIA